MPRRTPPAMLSRCQRCQCELALDQLSRDHRCPPCDVAYFESRDRLHTRAWFTVGFVLPWLLFAWVAATADLPHRSGGFRAITTGFPLLDFAIMCAIVAVFSGKVAVAVRRWFHRREFERTPPGTVGNALSSVRRATP